jgi:hypothetical protein
MVPKIDKIEKDLSFILINPMITVGMVSFKFKASGGD